MTTDADTLRRMAGLATPMALRVAVTLGLPDRLSDDPADAGQLAAELSVSPGALELLLSHLTTLGVLERTSPGYRTTAFGANLGAGFTKLLLNLDSAAGRAELAFVELAHSIRTGQAAYVARYGRGFYDDVAEHPHLRESFDQQMTLRLREQIPRIVAGYDWSRFTTVVDVGGGVGHLLAAILAANPGLRGHLVDVDATAARGNLRDLADRAEVTDGSFFDPLPAGADAYLLSDILHNWDDEHADRILARCAEAARPTGRVLVIEAGPSTDTEMDLAMLIQFGGRDRGVDELSALAAAHDLVLDTVTPLTPQRSLLEFRFA